MKTRTVDMRKLYAIYEILDELFVECDGRLNESLFYEIFNAIEDYLTSLDN